MEVPTYPRCAIAGNGRDCFACFLQVIGRLETREWDGSGRTGWDKSCFRFSPGRWLLRGLESATSLDCAFAIHYLACVAETCLTDRQNDCALIQATAIISHTSQHITIAPHHITPASSISHSHSHSQPTVPRYVVPSPESYLHPSIPLTLSLPPFS